MDYKLKRYFSPTPNQPAVNNPRSFTTKRTGSKPPYPSSSDGNWISLSWADISLDLVVAAPGLLDSNLSGIYASASSSLSFASPLP